MRSSWPTPSVRPVYPSATASRGPSNLAALHTDLGLRQRRLPDDQCEGFVDVFMKEMHATFPNMVRSLPRSHHESPVLIVPVRACLRDRSSNSRISTLRWLSPCCRRTATSIPVSMVPPLFSLPFQFEWSR